MLNSHQRCQRTKKKKKLTKAQSHVQSQPLTSPSPQQLKDITPMPIDNEVATPPFSPYKVHQDANNDAPLSTKGNEPKDFQGSGSSDHGIPDNPDNCQEWAF